MRTELPASLGKFYKPGTPGRLSRTLPALALAAALGACHSQSPPSAEIQDSSTNLMSKPAIDLGKAPAAPLPLDAALAQPRPAESPASPVYNALNYALILASQKKYDEALAKVDAVLKDNPYDKGAYNIRGKIYTESNQWDKAAEAYNAILAIDNKNAVARFNLVELVFMQKNYPAARTGFVALSSDPDWGDLASYKVFLCDLLNGDEDTARSELEKFNNVGSHPSYYCANVAWYAFHHEPEQARSWLESAVHIYTAPKAELYLSSLEELGYLPLPDMAR